MLRLSRNLPFEVHKVLHLSRNLHFEVHKVLRLSRNLHFEVHKVLGRPRLPRNLHFEVKPLRSLVPVTKSTLDHGNTRFPLRLPRSVTTTCKKCAPQQERSR